MYPPSPWRLRGQLFLSLFAINPRRLPPLPPGVLPVTVAGRAYVAAAWVDYEPGGDLSYRELLVAVLTRTGARPRASITHIWVDSEDSRDGGRKLWAIPKDLADLTVAPPVASAKGIAAATILVKTGTRGRWPTRLSLAQNRDGRLQITPATGDARLGPVRIAWSMTPDGPLAWLAGHRPILSLALADFRLRFGR
jgi:acetoacetate decarboxylase